MREATLVSSHDPDITATFVYTPPGTPGQAPGWAGICWCGRPMHYWSTEKFRREAQKHLNSHFKGRMRTDE